MTRIPMPAALLLLWASQMGASCSEVPGDPVASLAALLPDRPAATCREVNLKLLAAAETRRLDGALVLIKALTFHYESGNSNELRKGADLLPAVSCMRVSYGDNIVPLLFVEALQTDKAWMRNRCIVAIRALGDARTLARLKTVFSLGDPRTPAAREVSGLLEAATLEPEIPVEETEGAKRLRDAIQRIKEKDR